MSHFFLFVYRFIHFSVSKNWYGIEDNVFDVVSNGFDKHFKGFGLQSSAVPPIDRNNRFTDGVNDWPTIEESFGAGLPSQRSIQSVDMNPQPKTYRDLFPYSESQPYPEPLPYSEVYPYQESMPYNQLMTSFWTNVSKMSELQINEYANKNRNDIQSMVRLGSVTNQYNTTKFQKPIGTPLNRKSLSPPTDSSIEDPLPLSERSFNDFKKLKNSTYIQPKVRRRVPTLMECVFCKNNNEKPEMYRSHILKDPESNIQCPVLRAYDCPICHNGGGPKAHTVRYCPLNKAGIQSKLERLLAGCHPKMAETRTDWNYVKNSDLKRSRKYRKMRENVK